MPHPSSDKVCPRCHAPRSEDATYCICGYQLLDVSEEIDRMLEEVRIGQADGIDSPASTRAATRDSPPQAVTLRYERGVRFPIDSRNLLKFCLIYPPGAPRMAHIHYRLEGQGNSLHDLRRRQRSKRLDAVGGQCQFTMPFRAKETGFFSLEWLQIDIVPDTEDSTTNATDSESAAPDTSAPQAVAQRIELVDESVVFEVVDPSRGEQDTQQVHIHTGGDMLGSEVNISGLKPAGQEVEWVNVPIRLRERLPPASPLHSTKPTAVPSEPVSRMCLALSPRCRAERTLLLGQSTVRLGRSRMNTDLTLRVLPRSKENDELTRHISGSKPHCELVVSEQGVLLHDTGTRNGTSVNGARVYADAVSLPLDRPSDVTVGPALDLRILPFSIESDEPGRDPWHELGMADALWHAGGRLGLRSVLIERVSNLAHAEQYLLLIRHAAIGRGDDCELAAGDNARRERSGWLTRRGGQVWLYAEEEGLINVNGLPLPLNRACPLTPGSRVSIDEVEVSVEAFEQRLA